MPKAKTGCDHVLYALVSGKALKALDAAVEASTKKSGWPLSRSLYLDRLLTERALKEMKITRPEYKPHAKVKRKTVSAGA